jgi:hypothetical protein
MYEYGSELSDAPADIASSKQTMSNMDMLEQKLAIDNTVINGAVNEFIQDKKLWFRTLHRQHGDDAKSQALEKGREFLPNTALAVGRNIIPVEGDIGEEEFRKIVNERSLALH